MTRVHPRRAVEAGTEPTARSWPHALREIALTTAAVVGVICILAAVAAIAFGIKPLVFRSGSMSPEIPTGALGLARTEPADQLAAGDIVSVTNAAGVRITHRIAALDLVGGSAALTLKGDANDVADSETYRVAEADRLFFSVNRLGFVVSWLSSTPAVFAGGAVVGGLLVYAFRARSPRRETSAGGEHRAVVLTTVLVLAGSCTLSLVAPRALDTQAAWADTGKATGGTFAATTLAVPTQFSCANIALGGALYSWNGPTTDRYEITLTPALGGTPVRVDVPAGQKSYQHTALLGSGTATVRRFEVFGSTRWYSAASPGKGYLILLGVTACA